MGRIMRLRMEKETVNPFRVSPSVFSLKFAEKHHDGLPPLTCWPKKC